MTIHVNIGDAKTRLSELVAASLRGEDVVLQRAGHPVARIVAFGDAQQAAALARAAQFRAWIGSFEGAFPPGAGDVFQEPAYGDAELDSFETKLR